MRLRQVGNNQTVLSMPKTEVGRAMDVLFSYETPVVVHHPDSGKYYVSTTKFSPTTTRHKNAFVGDNDYTPITQEAIEATILNANMF
jgi:hypothetical protein